MTATDPKRLHPKPMTLLIAALIIVLAGSVFVAAQTTTSTIRGRVLDDSGSPIIGADIVATNIDTGFTNTAQSRDDGNFLLPGMTPGRYTILVASPAHSQRTEERTLLLGQTIDLVFRLSPSTVVTESITVVGDTYVDTRDTEVATNVTRQQIESLPQNDRNFLNFATLAPGVVVTTDDTRKEFRSGAQGASATNVYIDGVSFKNDLTQGGVIGQDSSRGNPFPQNAVQEFRVVTQNYSAEYQNASSGIITAITRSGTNRYSGDLFYYFQDKGLVAKHPMTGAEPEYERNQWGINFGGPITRDRMHFFFSYEANDQDRESVVSLGGDAANHPDLVQRLDLNQYVGTFVSPFRSDLGFAKLSFQPNSSSLIDWSATYRDETDIRSFGGTTSFESGEDVQNGVWGSTLRHQFTSSTWLNEASLAYQDFSWHPQPVTNDVGREYAGIIRIGGRGGEQEIGQKRLAIQDAVTLSDINMKGSHVIKVGGNAETVDYTVRKDFWGNPFFIFRNDPNHGYTYDFPAEAQYGIGDPDMSADNQKFGLFVQDEWSVNPALLLNLGLRWDYETNMLDPDYVTPPDVVAAYSSMLPAKYFTNGDDRETPTDMFQPRLGFSWDVKQDSRTVVYGGAGRYYDRVLYNDILDIRFRLQYKFGIFRFAPPGTPADEVPAGYVVWNDSYYTEAGLRQVMASGQTGNPEVFLLANDTEVPYSDQFNVGLRQSFGNMFGSLEYSNIRSYNGLSWLFGNRHPNGDCCIGVPGYANVLISDDNRKTWYDAFTVKLDRPFSGSTPWGFTFAYTYADAEQNGRDLFALNELSVEDYGRYAVPGTEKHRLVASGIIRGPWETKLAGILQYGSGIAYNVEDASAGWGFNEFQFIGGEGEGDSWQTLDLRGEKDFTFAGHTAGIIFEAFNVFNEEHYASYDGFFSAPRTVNDPPTNAHFGQPWDIVQNSQRRFQVGVRFGF